MCVSGEPECASASIAGSLRRPSIVEISPPDIARRRLANWGAIQADAVKVTRRETFEYGFQARRHLLIAYERAERDDGETVIEGLPKSTLARVQLQAQLRACRTSVLRMADAAGADARHLFLYRFAQSAARSGIRHRCPTISPRLFFFDQAVWDTALKLKAEVGNSDPGSRQYAEALSLVLMHELIRLESSGIRRNDAASWRPAGMATQAPDRIHRRASGGEDFAGRSRRARRPEPLSFCARLQRNPSAFLRIATIWPAGWNAPGACCRGRRSR